MSLLVGKNAPSFKAKAVVNGSEIVNEFSLDQFIGKKHVVLFFYPKDFSGVCPIELHEFQESISKFEERNVALVACSTDSEQSHRIWLQMPRSSGGIQGITYPIVSDITKTISMSYGVLFGEYGKNETGETIAHGPMIAFRGLFIIDKAGIVQHQQVNHMNIRRSVEEVLVTIDALQYFENNGAVCPADWKSKLKS